MSDDLYRLIPEEGKHLADSHDTDGAYRGVYLDDETNKPCGAGEFVKVDPSELTSSDDTNDNNENGISPEQAAAVYAGARTAPARGLNRALPDYEPHSCRSKTASE